MTLRKDLASLIICMVIFVFFLPVNLSFAENKSNTEQTEGCFECHKSQKNACSFIDSDHMKGSVTCLNCHPPHGKDVKDQTKRDSYKLCLSCHQKIAAKLELNDRHRIKEGIVSCGDCHDTHKLSLKNRLGEFKNENCLKCHTDKQGPFVYEHQAVQIKGCSFCHDPHGSVNRHMLNDQSMASLCFQCHSRLPVWHARFHTTTKCSNCHATIHGSQLSPVFIK